MSEGSSFDPAEPPPKIQEMLAFLDAWKQACQANPPTPPALLFHYTDIAALMSIVEKRELWASNVVYLNDQSEIRYSLDLLNSITSEKSEHRRSTSEADTVIQWIVHDFATLQAVYVVCFCTSDDLLSQWRGYGTQGGYAVGFASVRLKALCSGRVSLVRVEYDESTHRQRLVDLVNRWRETFHDVPEFNQDRRSWNLGAMLLAEAFSEIAVGFKNPVFEEEKEWRLVYRRFEMIPDDSLSVSFRHRNGMPLPYVSLALGDSSAEHRVIDDIVIGPTRYLPLAGYGTEQFLRALSPEYKKISVRHSTVPLRPY